MRFVLIATTVTMGLLFLSASSLNAQTSDPFWDIVTPKEPVKKRKKKRKKRKKKEALIDESFSEKRHSLGFGLSVPEIFPIEYSYRFSKSLSWDSYFVPPIPFNIRIELPRDTISRKEVVIDQPEIDIKLKAVYGPQIGTMLSWSPFTSGFYTRFGIGFRRLRLAGKVQSPIIIVVEGIEITTKTEFGIEVDAITESLLSRFELGWKWNVGRTGYINWTILGVLLPSQTKNRADVKTFVDAPGDNDDVEGALLTLKEEKEIELNDKAIAEMGPATTQILPVTGLTVGFRF